MRILNKILAVLALLLWGAVILLYAARGQLQLFIYPLYIPLLVATGVALVGFAFMEIWVKKQRPWARIVPLCLAAVLAFCITPAPLSATSALARGISRDVPRIDTTVSPIFGFAMATDSMELMDWLRVLGSDASPQRFVGKKMRVTGMVVHDGSQTHVVRMAIACCIADATPVGLPVKFATKPEAGKWVAVEGVLALDDLGTPFIDGATWSLIPLPSDPYAYL